MFREIYNNKELISIKMNYCNENNIEVCLSEELEESEDKLIILKIDEFYSTKNMLTPPKSIDCLIILKCDSNSCYNFYLIELKDIKRSKGFSAKDIRDKFETTFEDFMQNRFKDIFLNEEYCINNLKCYFISDPYCYKKRDLNLTREEFLKKTHTKALNTKFLNSFKPFKFRDKTYTITNEMPNPTINEC